jgi:hypothetical protein
MHSRRDERVRNWVTRQQSSDSSKVLGPEDPHTAIANIDHRRVTTPRDVARPLKHAIVRPSAVAREV